MLWINEDNLNINKSLVSEGYDSLDVNKIIQNYKNIHYNFHLYLYCLIYNLIVDNDLTDFDLFL